MCLVSEVQLLSCTHQALSSLVLTGGRPGIDMWASADKGKSWSRFNIAEEHNKRIAEKNLTFDMQVVNASDPHAGRALPEPQTSSYTGLAEASDGAMVVSYDRLANGWKERTWNGTVLEPGCWGNEDVVFTMRVAFDFPPGAPP